MTGFDAQKYEYAIVKAKENNLVLTTHGDSFILRSLTKNYGHFATLNEAFQFLCGYEVGRSEVNQE